MSAAPKVETPATRRTESRDTGSQGLFPVSMVARLSDQELTVEVINYHHKGACVRFRDPPENILPRLKRGEIPMDFYLGRKRLRASVAYRVAWESLLQDGQVGLEFLSAPQDFIPRPDRFSVHPEFTPQISAQDPLNPNRTLFLNAQNVSENGMLARTSLANKHLLPGLSLRDCSISFPGQKPIQIQLFIANTRRCLVPGLFELGLSVEGDRAVYVDSARRYISHLSPTNPEEADEESDPIILTKQLKSGLTYRAISNTKDYEKVLKLRQAAYSKAGKTKQGMTWKDQGEGLDKEGMLLAGFLGSRMIACVELRFSDGPLPFRSARNFPAMRLPLKLDRLTVEINKLVIHPKAHGTDTLVGVFQKIHCMVVSRGGVDILVASTDELSHLYLPLGFRRTGLTIPHPYLDNKRLSILVMPMEYYLEAKHINPLAWVAVYERNQHFLESIGVAKSLEARMRYRVKRLIGWTMRPLLPRKKARRKAKELARPESHPSGIGSSYIDPKWTSQHIIAPIMKPYIAEADRMLGAAAVDAMLAELRVPRAYFQRQSNWVSVAFLDALLDLFSKRGDIAELSRKAGERSMQSDQIGIKYYFLKHFVTPAQAIASTEKILPKFNQSRSYLLEWLRGNACRISIGTIPGLPLPKHRVSCLNWQASFEAYFKIMTGTIGQVNKLSCCYDGDATCTYELSWTQSKRIASTVLFGGGLTAALALLFFFTVPRFSSLSFQWFGLLALAIGGTATALRELYLRRADSQAFSEQFEKLEQEGNEKYSELQQAKQTLDERYQEARLLEETAKAIQSSPDLLGTLNASLDGICANFGFDRAFITLADESRKTMRTSAVACIGEGAEELWKFNVDISTAREGALFLSSVYHTGNPVLIDDVEPHFFQFNEASRGLIRRLGTRGFIMVPIPGEGSAWGVLIADKTSPTKSLNRMDLTLLQRVAQHLGIALDKQSKLDRERSLRQLFQKYVPLEILNQVQPGTIGSFSAQSRRIACLFLDIRDFTATAEKLPPTVILDLLNRVFTLVHTTITQYGGWIDKFLGDGALITWGAVGEPSESVLPAYEASLAILDALPAFNQQLVSEGFSPIRLGLGLNWGSATVGNLGAQSRMEFTSIGGTVNIASRLEALSKELGASLVVSESVLAELGQKQRANLTEKDGVSIRGLERPVRIGLLQKKHL